MTKQSLSKDLVALIDSIQSEAVKSMINDFFGKTIVKYTSAVKGLVKKTEANTSFDKLIYEEFTVLTNELVMKGEELVSKFETPLQVRQAKNLFRQTIKDYVYIGPASRRAFDRPRGYPGDYGIIEMFYDNEVQGHGFGQYCDRYLLDQDYVQAVRSRKDYMKNWLIDYLGFKKQQLGETEILNLGSGSCRELRELNPELLNLGNFKFTLLDQDAEALEYSRVKLSSIHPGHQFDFIEGSVLNYARRGLSFANHLNKFNVIYSIGLADYIPDQYLQDIISTSFRLLKDGGSFVLAHKNVYKHKSIISDWMADWYFFPRSKENLLSMFQSISGSEYFDLQVSEIGEGHVFFIEARMKSKVTS